MKIILLSLMESILLLPQQETQVTNTKVNCLEKVDLLLKILGSPVINIVINPHLTTRLFHPHNLEDQHQ